jgi:DNA-binding XRE family transcriptional regulator
MATSPELIRGARAALAMTQDELASEAGVTYKTVGRLEAGIGTSLDTLIACQRVLEKRGVQFFEVDGRQGFSIPADGI